MYSMIVVKNENKNINIHKINNIILVGNKI